MDRGESLLLSVWCYLVFALDKSATPCRLRRAASGLWAGYETRQIRSWKMKADSIL